jgi:hypothetical protein
MTGRIVSNFRIIDDLSAFPFCFLYQMFAKSQQAESAESLDNLIKLKRGSPWWGGGGGRAQTNAYSFLIFQSGKSLID